MTGVLTTWSSGFPAWLLEGCLLVPSKFKNMSLWTPLKWQNLHEVGNFKKKMNVPFFQYFTSPVKSQSSQVVGLWSEDCICAESCDGMKCFTLLQSAYSWVTTLSCFLFCVFRGVFLTLQAGPAFVLCVVVVYQIWALEMVDKARSCWWNPSAVTPGEFLVGVAGGQMDKCIYG